MTLRKSFNKCTLHFCLCWSFVSLELRLYCLKNHVLVTYNLSRCFRVIFNPHTYVEFFAFFTNLTFVFKVIFSYFIFEGSILFNSSWFIFKLFIYSIKYVIGSTGVFEIFWRWQVRLKLI